MEVGKLDSAALELGDPALVRQCLLVVEIEQ